MQPGDCTGFQEIRWGSYERIPLLRDFMGFAARNVHKVRSGPRFTDRQSSGHVRAYTADGFTLVHAVGSGFGAEPRIEERNPSAIAEDHIDRICMLTVTTGERRIFQGDETLVSGHGVPAFYFTSEPYLAETTPREGCFDLVALHVPRRYVAEKSELPTATQGGDRSAKQYGLACDALTLLTNHAWQLAPGQFRVSAQSVADLFMVAFSGQGGQPPSIASVPALNLERVKRIIRQRMSDPDLALADVAESAGLSLNYLHKLFRQDGTTMWSYLKSERLKSARGMLRARSARLRSITDVAIACGFSDASFFSRAFSRQFGMTPSQARAAD